VDVGVCRNAGVMDIDVEGAGGGLWLGGGDESDKAASSHWGEGA
jgi:hypothetical protein